MYTASAQTLISGALQELGVLALGVTPRSAESEDALVALNLMVDSLGLEPGMLYKLVRTTKTLASGTASYTVGSAGSIVLARPARIPKAGLILNTGASPTTEVEIDVLTDEEYAAVSQKAATAGAPRAVFYDRGSDSDGYGLIYPLPIPNVGTTQLVLYTPGGAVSQFADLTTSYSFADGLGLVLLKNLALHLKPRYPQATVSRELIIQAAAAKRTFKSAHLVPLKRTNSAALMGGGGFFDQEAGIFR